MPKKISDMAIEKAPTLPNSISVFQSKLAIAHYAQGSITDYCHAIYKAVVHIGKLPEEFTQTDVDGYFRSMLGRSTCRKADDFCVLESGIKMPSCYRCLRSKLHIGNIYNRR